MSLSLSPHAAIGIAYGLNLLLMVTFISVVALVLGRTILRHDASARYLLCLTALACILLSPFMVVCLSKAHYGLLFFALPTAAQLQSWPTSTILTASGSQTTGAVPLAQGASWWGRLSLFLPIWGVGTAWGLVRFVRGWQMVARLRRTVHPLDPGELGGLLEQVQRTLRVTVPPVFTSDHVTTPVAIGLLRPVVILPDELLAALTPTQLRHVLLHECAHVAFRHAFGGVVQRMVNTIYWPHPSVVALCRELARAREEVCDDVASQEDGAACYARTLLTIAQGISAAPQHASALALLGPGTSLEKRISGLLDPRRNRMVGVKRWKLWAVTGVVTLTTALAAAVRVVADDAKAQQQTEQQRVAQAEKVRAEQAVVQAKVQLDRRLSRMPQTPILIPTVQAKLEQERRDLELDQAKLEAERLDMARRSGDAKLSSAAIKGLGVGNVKLSSAPVVVEDGGTATLAPPTGDKSHVIEDGGAGTLVVVEDGGAGTLAPPTGDKFPDRSMTLRLDDKQSGVTSRYVVKPGASTPGKAKTARDVAPTQIPLPFVFKVAAKPQGDSAGK